MLPDSYEHEEYSPSQSDKHKSNGATISENDPSDENLISCTSPSESIRSDRHYFGWCNYRPKCLQNLLSAKWALFWMCWAGALQGEKTK